MSDIRPFPRGRLVTLGAVAIGVAHCAAAQVAESPIPPGMERRGLGTYEQAPGAVAPAPGAAPAPGTAAPSAPGTAAPMPGMALPAPAPGGALSAPVPGAAVPGPGMPGTAFPATAGGAASAPATGPATATAPILQPAPPPVPVVAPPPPVIAPPPPPAPAPPPPPPVFSSPTAAPPDPTRSDAPSGWPKLVECVLLSELGADLVSDPSFARMVDHVQQQLRADAELAAVSAEAAQVLLQNQSSGG
jgi:hypothetical protein